ncbi:hypothetical protein OH76DRAFT_1410180 [Lentinus brumalis]|uniref:F-box domain-containing protein n=1 Tax=Lentinus brumalis TaxID=2498619 RepID=A0A371CSX9_9APHY|nr:hypothetical protein OH76DRAFT_1410180 [Polyporus brumalis]
MAAAHALSIPEIVLEVAGHVQAEPVSEHRPALARLARVNRLFHDHVVRLLWADLPNMDPLFKLLSNCVSLPTPVNAAGGNAHAAPQPLHSMRLVGPTPNEDIVRIREYAGLVRRLDFCRPTGIPFDESPNSTSRGIRLEPHSLASLLLQTGLPLLPSLTKLTLPVTPPYNSDPTFLICPSLRDLTISFADWHVDDLTENIGALFGGVFAQNNRLTHLRVQSESYMHHDPADEHFTPWLSGEHDWVPDGHEPEADGASAQAFCDALAAVAMLNDLEVFSMATMSTGVAGRDLVTALSALPRLRDCSFGINIAQDVLQDVLRTTPPGFPSLRALTVSNVVRGRELELFDSPHLRELTIYHPDRLTDDWYRNILETVGRRFPGLRRLTWILGRRNIFAEAPDFLAVTIQPLFVLDGLQELSIDVQNRPVSDADVVFLAGGLPRLSRLDLRFHMAKTGPSARALLALARGCPSLRALYVGGVLFTEADEAQAGAVTFPFVGNRLQYFHIGDLRCEGEARAAMIVDLLFPFLDVRECRRRAAKDRWRKGHPRCWTVSRRTMQTGNRFLD